MRILWLKASPLLPLDKGGNLRTWHLMRNLASRHHITYLSFGPPASEGEPGGDRSTRSAPHDMAEVASRVETVRRREPRKGSLRFYLAVLRNLLDPLPYAVGRYRSRAFRARVKRLLAPSAFDLIVCDFLPPAISLPSHLPCPVVLFTHNVEAEIWRRHADSSTTPVSRWLYRLQHSRMRRFEHYTLKRFRNIIAVSEADGVTFARLYPDAVALPVPVVATGVDTTFFAEATASVHPRRLVFTGSMDWLPNQDAMVYFCREILPLIRANDPGVTLSIVGREPTSTVKALARRGGVIVTGSVDDVRPHVLDATVYVVPLRIGGGTRLKIFEAMAMGKAVVATTIGAEGLPVVDGQHLLIADSPSGFAEAVTSLLQNPQRRLALGTAARALVREHYDWSAVSIPFESMLIKFASPVMHGAGYSPTRVAAS